LEENRLTSAEKTRQAAQILPKISREGQDYLKIIAEAMYRLQNLAALPVQAEGARKGGKKGGAKASV
jgi:hypothetical protein